MESNFPADLQALSDELQALGGGDSRISPVEVHVRVQPGVDKLSNCIDVVGSDTIIRDRRLPSDASASVTDRRYHFQSSLPSQATQSDVYQLVGESALDWLWDGFNASVVSYGQVGTGKTFSLFGHGVTGEVEGEGLCPRILAALFNRIDHSSPESFAVGMSCWDVLATGVVDLLSDGDQAVQHKPATVHVYTLRHARELLRHARAKSINWSHVVGNDQIEFLPNRAHSFIRITVYNSELRRVSSIHFADLAGIQPLGTARASAWQALGQERERERRNLNQHLLAFNRLLNELVQLPTTGGAVRLASARDTKYGEFMSHSHAYMLRLNQYLGPLFSGNSKVYLVTTVSGDREHYLDTVNVLRNVARIQGHQTACVRLLNVDLVDLDFVPLDRVLPSPARNVSPSRTLPSDSNLAASLGTLIAGESITSVLGIAEGSRSWRRPTTFTNADRAVPTLPASSEFDRYQPVATTPRPHVSSSTSVRAMETQAATSERLGLKAEDLIPAKAESNEVILGILRAAERDREKLKVKYDALQHDTLERNAQYELEIEDLKEQVVNLRSQLRKLKQDSQVEDLFEHYENDISRLLNETAALRSENRALVEKMSAWSEAEVSTSTGGAHKPLLGVSVRRIMDKIQRELDEVKRENEEYRSQHRVHHRQKKSFDESSRKVAQLSRELSSKTELISHRHQAETHIYERLAQLESANAQLLNDRELLLRDFKSSQESVKRLQNELRKKTEVYTRATKSMSSIPVSRDKKEAIDVCQRLEREIGSSNPRVLALVRKLERYISTLEKARVEAEARDAELSNMLGDQQRKGAQDAHKLIGIMKDAYSSLS